MSSGYPEMVNMDMTYLRKFLTENGIGIVRFCESIGKSPTWFYKHEGLNGRTNFRMARLISSMFDVPYEKLVPDNVPIVCCKKDEAAERLHYHPIPANDKSDNDVIRQDALFKLLRAIADALNIFLENEKKGA